MTSRGLPKGAPISARQPLELFLHRAVKNPAALQEGSPLYGMPILEAYKAKSVIVNKRSMAASHAGLDYELFYMDKTMMVFGDAKKLVEEMGKAIDLG